MQMTISGDFRLPFAFVTVSKTVAYWIGVLTKQWSLTWFKQKEIRCFFYYKITLNLSS